MSAARSGYTLDAGALIALQRDHRQVRSSLTRALHNSMPIVVPAIALAQAWRGGPRQARLSRLLASRPVAVAALDESAAKAVGVLCGKSRHRDIADVHVALCAKARGHHVVTSDPGDLRDVGPELGIVEI